MKSQKYVKVRKRERNSNKAKDTLNTADCPLKTVFVKE